MWTHISLSMSCVAVALFMLSGGAIRTVRRFRVHPESGELAVSIFQKTAHGVEVQPRNFIFSIYIVIKIIMQSTAISLDV